MAGSRGEQILARVTEMDVHLGVVEDALVDGRAVARDPQDRRLQLDDVHTLHRGQDAQPPRGASGAEAHHERRLRVAVKEAGQHAPHHLRRCIDDRVPVGLAVDDEAVTFAVSIAYPRRLAPRLLAAGRLAAVLPSTPARQPAARSQRGRRGHAGRTASEKAASEKASPLHRRGGYGLRGRHRFELRNERVQPVGQRRISGERNSALCKKIAKARVTALRGGGARSRSSES